MRSLKSQEKRFEKEFENMSEIPDVEEAILVKFDENITVPNGKVILEYSLDKLCIEDRVLSEKVYLKVVGPQHICIIGRNGVGKTTLLSLIAKELFAREDIKVAYMPQNYDDLWDNSLTPIEFLSIDYTKEEQTRIRTYLGSMKYTADEMTHSIG